MVSTVKEVETGIAGSVDQEWAARKRVNETVYNGSEVCPGCGCLMTPLQVLFGTGLCPRCQNKAYNEHIQRRMV